uniref:tetratricopeptide repeat protein 25-like n=1 Tax=Podarcis muralis TaxID=64176 RepID=UPI0010A09EBC|nr:tetratricopeptide repeat protein 25-like [Podarcis muralis]
MGDSEGEVLRGTFPSLMAEGTMLSRRGELAKALTCYTYALQLQPGDRNCLVARSKCYLRLGDTENALKDAEASLAADKGFTKGLYQKAEALYTMGDFEFALVYYHRGHKIRPELPQFRLGIQKSQEAIENSVGSPSSVKLENRADLFFLSRQAESKRAKQKLQVKFPKKDAKYLGRQEPVRNEKTERQLLGELYVDKAFLEKLLKDEDLTKSTTKQGVTVGRLIQEGLSYLDNPHRFLAAAETYLRPDARTAKLMLKRWTRGCKQREPSEVARYILKEHVLTSGSPERSCQKAEQVLKKIQGWSDEEIPNRSELVGNLYSCIGNAQIEMGNMAAALQSHQVDLDIAKEKISSTTGYSQSQLACGYSSLMDTENNFKHYKTQEPPVILCPAMPRPQGSGSSSSSQDVGPKDIQAVPGCHPSRLFPTAPSPCGHGSISAIFGAEAAAKVSFP